MGRMQLTKTRSWCQRPSHHILLSYRRFACRQECSRTFPIHSYLWLQCHIRSPATSTSIAVSFVARLGLAIGCSARAIPTTNTSALHWCPDRVFSGAGPWTRAHGTSFRDHIALIGPHVSDTNALAPLRIASILGGYGFGFCHRIASGEVIVSNVDAELVCHSA